MYLAALSLLDAPPDNLSARVRISHICHSLREVMNRVISSMETSAAPEIKPSTSELVQSLPDLLVDFSSLDQESNTELVQIPRSVADVLEQLFKSAVGEKRRSRDSVASFLTDDGNAEHTAVTKWIHARNFFVKWSHLGDRQLEPNELPSDDQIRQHLAIFDELFDGVTTAFFTISHSIEDLLVEINAKDGNDA